MTALPLPLPPASFQLLGARHLCTKLKLPLTGKLRVVSRVGSRRKTEEREGYCIETYPAARPLAEDDLRGHLAFHLKHEVPNFEFLARFFEATGPELVQNWIEQEPTGAYARRAAFLLEWFTGQDCLHRPETVGGNYVPVLDEKRLVCAPPEYSARNPRWRVLDNMPGTRFFCPSVVRTPALLKAEKLDVSAMMNDLRAEFGQKMLLRAATWMTLRESRASFAIEREDNATTRIERFAKVLATQTGKSPNPLALHILERLQASILGEDTILQAFGVRQSPVFVAESGLGPFPEDRVHYLAPPASDLPQMLEGLEVFLHRTQGQSPVLRAAVIAFGFVYVHPLADGNGRMHRFLINDILQRDKAVEEGLILPVSAVITADPSAQRAYEEVLASVSAPLMEQLRPLLHFSSTDTLYPDGISSDLVFTHNELARPSWRYPKLEDHVLFLEGLIKRAIQEQMRSEAAYLRRHRAGRLAIKEILDMPNLQADRILRAYGERPGKAFGKKLFKAIPALEEKNRASRIHQALGKVWEENPLPAPTNTRFFPPS